MSAIFVFANRIHRREKGGWDLCWSRLSLPSLRSEVTTMDDKSVSTGGLTCILISHSDSHSVLCESVMMAV